MLSAVTSLQMLERNLPQARKLTANDPTVKRETAYYLAHISSIKTSKDFVNNYQLFNYAMTAYGLSDMAYAKAFMQKVMDGGVSNTKSMANQLSDPRFRAFAAAFDFGNKGAATTADSAANTTTTSKFVEQTLEDNAGQQNQGVQLALYFQRKAPNIASGLSILADKALFRFVQTAFNIPTPGTGTTVEQDAARIESKVNIADLKDPAKVQKMVAHFAVMWDLNNPDMTSSNSAIGLISSLTSALSGTGITPNLLLSAQKRYTTF
jgi:hypothetical protein